MSGKCMVCQKQFATNEKGFMGLCLCSFCQSSPNVIDSIATPLIIYNKQFQVVDINYAACETLGTNKDEAIGKSGGEVFNCLYSKLSTGCGNTFNCIKCKLRDVLVGTLATGTGEENVNCKTELVSGNRIDDFHLMVTSAKVNKYIYLKFKMKKSLMAV